MRCKSAISDGSGRRATSAPERERAGTHTALHRCQRAALIAPANPVPGQGPEYVAGWNPSFRTFCYVSRVTRNFFRSTLVIAGTGARTGVFDSPISETTPAIVLCCKSIQIGRAHV